MHLSASLIPRRLEGTSLILCIFNEILIADIRVLNLFSRDIYVIDQVLSMVRINRMTAHMSVHNLL